MSLLLSAVYENSVQMLTDGAALDKDGNLQAIYAKAKAVSSPPLIISGRGNTIVLELARTAVLTMAEHCSFDEILENIESGLQHAAESIVETGAHIEIVIAGLSETRGFSHYVLSSRQYLDWLPAFKMTEIPETAYVFGGGADLEALLAEGVEPAMLAEAGESAWSLFGGALASAFRKKSGGHATGLELDVREGMPCIGGHADVTIVTREGVTVERVVVWDDEFGKPIDPDRLAFAA